MQSLASTQINRRKLLGTVGSASAAMLVAPLIGCGDQTTISLPVTAPSIVDVLNFALNLEYLEASFYLYVTTGSGLSVADMGAGAGTVAGGAQVAFSNSIVASAAAQLAKDEQSHVEFLRATITSIGGTPVSMPSINLSANGAVTSDATFLAAARQFEAVGISAYIGGAQYLTGSAAALSYAAQILDTEAQHEGLLRELCFALGASSPAVDSLDHPPSSAQIFNTGPTDGLNPVRTVSQVLQIVYASPGSIGVSSGGFFPNGMNGSLTTS
jgi:hypothetical protein